MLYLFFAVCWSLTVFSISKYSTWRKYHLETGAVHSPIKEMVRSYLTVAFLSFVTPLLAVTQDNAEIFVPIFALMVLGLFAYRYSQYSTWEEEQARKKNEPKPEPVLDNTPSNDEAVADILQYIKVPQPFFVRVHEIIEQAPQTARYNAETYAGYINMFFDYLPKAGLLDTKKKTTSLISLIAPSLDDEGERFMERFQSVMEPHHFTALLHLKAGITIPEKIRTQHHQIVGGSGQGKTTLLKSMILDDVEAGHSVVVIDSQNSMINELATKVPPERLILVDPTHCPPGLNLFQSGTSSELFEYIFSGQGVQMTGKQAMYYTFVCQLVTAAGGGMTMMRRILEPGDAWREYAHHLRDTSLSFFETEFSGKRQDTREEIRRRIFGLLANEKLETMIGADDNTIDIKSAIDGGAVLLISTDKNPHGLGNAGASLLGRIFIAQVMREVMARGPGGKRTYLYVDELQDYAEDSQVLFNLFEQARKYELGMIVAHQSLGRITSELRATISSNTAIKFAGGVSDEDARKLAGQMNTPADVIFNQTEGNFAAWFKGYGTLTYRADTTVMNNMPELSSLSAIRDKMRREYGAKKRPDEGRDDGRDEGPEGPKGPKPGGVTRGVPESGEW